MLLRISAIQLQSLCANENIIRLCPQACRLLGVGHAVSGGIVIGQLISDRETREVVKSNAAGYILLCTSTACINTWHLNHAAGFLSLSGFLKNGSI